MKNWEQNEKDRNIVSFDIMTTEEDDYERYFTVYCKKDKKNNYSKICFVDKYGIRYDYYVPDKMSRNEGESDQDYALRVAWARIYKIPTEKELGIVNVSEQEKINKDKVKDFKNAENKENIIYSFLNDKSDPKKITSLKPDYFLSYVGKNKNIIGFRNINRNQKDENGKSLPKNYLGKKILDLIEDNPQLIDKIANHDLKTYYKKHAYIAVAQNLYNKFNETAVNKPFGAINYFVQYKFDKNNYIESFTITYQDPFKKKDVEKTYSANYYYITKALKDINSYKYKFIEDKETGKKRHYTLADVKNICENNKKSQKSNSQNEEIVLRAICKKNGISYDAMNTDASLVKANFNKLAEITFDECLKFLTETRIEDHTIGILKAQEKKMPRDKFLLNVQQLFSNKSYVFNIINNSDYINEMLGTQPAKEEEIDTEEEISQEEINEEDEILDVGTAQKGDEIVPGSNSREEQDIQPENVDYEDVVEVKEDLNEEIPFDEEDYTKKLLANKLGMEDKNLDDYDVAELQYMANHPEEFENEQDAKESVEIVEEQPVKKEENVEQEQPEQKSTKEETKEPSLMENFHSLYVKYTQFTNGVLLVPVKDNKQLEFPSYKSVKDYIKANHVKGETAEELYHNFVASVEKEYEKAIKTEAKKEEPKKENTPDEKTQSSKETVNDEIKFENPSSEKLYKVLTAIAKKLDNALSVVNNFRKQLVNGKTFNPKHVLDVVASNIKDAFDFAEIKDTRTKEPTAKEADFIKILDEKTNSLTQIINNQNETIGKLNDTIGKLNDTVSKQNEIITALYSKISLDKFDEVKTEIDQINEKYVKAEEINKDDLTK